MVNIHMLKVNMQADKSRWMKRKMGQTTMESEREMLDKRLQLVVSEGFLKRLNDWRAKKPGIPNQSKAIREAMERIFREGR